MGAACCAGAAVAGSAASAGPSTLLDGTIYSFLSAIPIALYHYYPQITIALVTLLALGASTFYLVLVLLTPESKGSSPSELTYLSTASEKPQPLASLLDELSEIGGEGGAVQLSVVVPAYNEKERLPVMLKETVEFLEGLKKEKRSLVQGLPQDHSNGSNGVVANGIHVNGSASTTRVHSALHNPLSSYEIVIVDDGSKDNTHQVALDFARSHPSAGSTIRVIRLIANRGKGGAVRHGVLHSRGHLVLFADADGATSFRDVSKLCHTLSQTLTTKGHGVAVGSRAHMVKSDAVVKRSLLRNFLMHSFHLFLTLLLRPPTLGGVMGKITGRSGKKVVVTGKKGGCKVVSLPVQPEVKDTQCGFKLFTRPTAQLVFPASHIDGWIFDVELLILAQTSSQLALQQQPHTTEEEQHDEVEGELNALKRLPIPVVEVSVDWQEVKGSKIDLLKDSIRMALDLIVIRANYGLGRWKPPAAAV
ncbi:glycosyltransferase [Pseudozyma hubeiensis SY62]|uniref:dolichyl-phosphate beta-glucosyltransferase n=1 Tax=Pseudozyma hubeiensis (strain SY62) TaxID=1305764 RepID=R9P6P0_PSEHS|nr:glycosyltransferase [Pseudozyma hubeiensis SY62]GAC97026.1 glycosyltransferase [Pseudozyma hubeiensis SY62]